MRPSPLSLRLLGLLVACAVLPVTAFAQQEEEEDPWTRTGPYVGASVVGGAFSTLNNELEKQLIPLGLEVSAIPGSGPGSRPGEPNDVEHDMGLGYDVYAGYRVHKYLAAEAEFEWITDVEFDIDNGTFVDGETMTFAASVRGILPLGRFEPFAVIGIGAMYAGFEDSQDTGVRFDEGSGFMWKLGGGFDLHVTEHVGIRFTTDWVQPQGKIKDLDYASVGGGLFYRF